MLYAIFCYNDEDVVFSWSKEQDYVVDCATLDEAVDFTRDLARANPGGAYEIRPVRLYLPGSEMSDRS